MKNKGITLVALIITIVVLLVLAMLVIGKLSDNEFLIQLKEETSRYIESLHKFIGGIS